ncbi:hypothetical protein MMC21_005454 [Puttea exsequens]|nr:hypothetical protein [Puttea exsequens]
MVQTRDQKEIPTQQLGTIPETEGQGGKTDAGSACIHETIVGGETRVGATEVTTWVQPFPSQAFNSRSLPFLWTPAQHPHCPPHCEKKVFDVVCCNCLYKNLGVEDLRGFSVNCLRMTGEWSLRMSSPGGMGEGPEVD